MKHPGLNYSSPLKFTLRQRLILATAPRAGYMVLRGIGLTCSIEVIDKQHFDKVQNDYGTVVLGFWHETLAIALNIYCKTAYHTLTSYSFDGELAARCCEVFGVHALRGSSSRGGSDGLRNLVAATQLVKGIGFTPDGPRGPRRVAKAGIALLSARSGIPIVPNAIVAEPCWRLGSWDRMAIPKPFCRVRCAYDEPIPPPADSSAEAIESTRRQVEDRLNALHDRLESEPARGA